MIGDEGLPSSHSCTEAAAGARVKAARSAAARQDGSPSHFRIRSRRPRRDCSGRAANLEIAPANADSRERAGRVKGAQRRSGPLTRPSAPGKLIPERRRNSWRCCGTFRVIRCRVHMRCRSGLRAGESGPTFPGQLREKPRAKHHAIIGAHRVNARVNVRLELALLDTAPQHIVDTSTWGVSDPAGHPLGDVCVSRAGGLTPPILYRRANCRAAQNAALLCAGQRCQLAPTARRASASRRHTWTST
jgi:hypothetical protein